MEDWFNSIKGKGRDKAKDLYSKAKTLEGKIGVLREWHPKGYANLKPIGNLEQYFKYIRLVAHPRSWFRGESSDHGYLIPKLYRNIPDEKVTDQHEKERNYFLEFKRRARSFTEGINPNDTWSWYFLIQHYGGPTRLLDWTQDAAIALFFALDTKRDGTDNPIVTVMEAPALVDYASKELGEKKLDLTSVLYPGEPPTEKWISNLTGSNISLTEEIPDSPIPLLPPYSDPRITAQRSCFTLFGKRRNGFYINEKQIVCPCCGQRIFTKLVIDGHKKKNLRQELIKIGTSSGKVYPGLEGINRELTEEVFGGYN
ncbi:MAG: FRG domain-containing protein [Spirochaetes bacterium]|nr:FRG domain-containing protein [Spirochaetota bacterium]